MQAQPLLALLLAVQPPSGGGLHAHEAALHATRSAIASLAGALPAAPTEERRLQHGGRVYGYLPWWSSLDRAFRWDLVSDIVLFAAEMGKDGSVQSWHRFPDPALVAAAHDRGVRVHLCAALFNRAGGNEIAAFLATPDARRRALSVLVDALAAAGADGLDLDFEVVPPASRDAFSTFVEEARDALRARNTGLELTLAVPASISHRGTDPARLAAAASRLLVMSYDFHGRASAIAGPIAPLSRGGVWSDSVEDDPRGWLAAVPAEKLALGLAYYGYAWPVRGDAPGAPALGPGLGVPLREALALAPPGERRWDPASQSPWAILEGGAGRRQLWYEDGASLDLKLRLAQTEKLGGAMLWALGYDRGRTEAWEALERFSTAAQGPRDPAAPLGCGAGAGMPAQAIFALGLRSLWRKRRRRPPRRRGAQGFPGSAG